MAEQFDASLPPLEEPKKKNTTLIIVIVVLVVLCCCCIGGVVVAWQFGDKILDALGIAAYQSGLLFG